MPITASTGGLTYLKGGSGFGAYDWWVAYNSGITYNSIQYIGNNFYMTGTDPSITNTAFRSFFLSVIPENITSPDWSNRINFNGPIGGSTAGGISKSFGVNPNTNVLFQTGAASLPAGSFTDLWGQVGYYNTDGSLIQNFVLYPTAVANIGDVRVPGAAIYNNNNFYSIGVNTTSSFQISGIYYPVQAITFTKYATSTTSLTPPQIYRLITFGAATSAFNPTTAKLSPNGNYIVSGSLTTTSAPTTNVPFVLSTGELTSNWARQFDWVNRFNGAVVDMAIDSNNNIYLAMSSSFGSPQRAVIAKLDSSGTLLWSIITNATGAPTGIACDDTGCYVTIGSSIYNFDTNGNFIYSNKFTGVPTSTIVSLTNPLIIGGALYCVGNITSIIGAPIYGAIWKIPKDGTIPGDGDYHVGTYHITYTTATKTGTSFSVTMTTLSLFESTPSYGTTSQATFPIDTTIYPNTLVPLT